MAILSIIWAVICKAVKSIAKGFKWLYDKTHGGIAWLLGGIGTVLAFLLFKGRTAEPSKPPLRPGLEQVKKQAEDLVKKAEQTKQAAEKALNHADEVVSEVENRRKKRQGPILPIIVIAILTAGVMLSGIALATESPLPLNINATAITDQGLANAYLEQVKIAEEWRQRCLEADEDNAKLIAEIRILQGQIQSQNATIDSLTSMIKTLQGVIEELKAWSGQLYSLIATLTKRNVGVSAGAMLKIDLQAQQPVRFDGIMLGINW